jgi:hypothetical protein
MNKFPRLKSRLRAKVGLDEYNRMWQEVQLKQLSVSGTEFLTTPEREQKQ